MNYEIVGKLIFKEETQHISDRFQKKGICHRSRERKKLTME